MQYRKIYLKIRVFLYSNRHLSNAILLVLMSATLLSTFVNSIVFGGFINNMANNYELSGKYSDAISLYNIEYAYYSVFHFSEGNKEIYFELPYKKATCYLKSNDKKKSVESMLYGLKAIQKQYGIFSKETAYFIRKYLIEYYLDNNKHSLATQEFHNLLLIYKTIGYTNNEMADMIRLSGDLYYSQKEYDVAMGFYRKSYATLSKQSRIDYETIVKIINRVAQYEVLNKKDDDAVKLYQSSITEMKNSGARQNNLVASLLMSLGDLYIQKDKTKNAITCYEEALVFIKKLPRANYLRQNYKTYLVILKELYNKDGQFHKVNEIEVELTKERRFSFL